MTKRVIVRVPASTANLGPGFDSLGLAFELYAWIDMREADRTSVVQHGEHLEGIPTDKHNLIYEVAQSVFQRAGVSIPELAIEVYSDIPLTRGLGSSASAIVGGLVAANALIGSPLSSYELFQLATSFERHPDNVGASLFGGVVVAAWDGKQADYVRLEPPQGLTALVCVPHFELPTEKARHALPREVPMADAVFNVGHTGLLVAALATGDLAMVARAMRDKLHQPHRAALVPGMNEVLEGAVRHGAVGAALSGAGPTLLAFTDASKGGAQELERFLRATMASHGIACDTFTLRPSLAGAVVLPIAPGDDRSLPERIREEVRS